MGSGKRSDFGLVNKKCTYGTVLCGWLRMCAQVFPLEKINKVSLRQIEC